MQLMTKLIITTVLTSQLVACFPVVVGGAATVGTMAADRRTSGMFVDDQGIELKAINRLRNALGEESHINVTSFNLNVLLTGQVPDSEKKEMANELLKEIQNIASVTNELTIGPKTSLSSRSRDALITSRVKTGFVTARQFPVNVVKVVTEDSVVYLMGIVSREEAQAAVDVARLTNGVTRVVKVFEYK